MSQLIAVRYENTIIKNEIAFTLKAYILPACPSNLKRLNPNKHIGGITKKNAGNRFMAGITFDLIC